MIVGEQFCSRGFLSAKRMKAGRSCHDRIKPVKSAYGKRPSVEVRLRSHLLEQGLYPTPELSVIWKLRALGPV